MSTVSQIITFRKGRAFTTRKPSPPVVPAPPATPSATVTIGAPGATAGAQAATYLQRVQKSPTVEIDTRPPRPGHDPVDELAETSATRSAADRAAPSPAPTPDARPADRADDAGRRADRDGDPRPAGSAADAARAPAPPAADTDDDYRPTMPVDLIA